MCAQVAGNLSYLSSTCLCEAQVDAETISRFAYPCCRRGGECCPLSRRGTVRQGCCSQSVVAAWLARTIRHGGEDLQYYTRTSWWDQKWNVMRGSHQEALRLASQWRLNSSVSGLTFYRFRREQRLRRYVPA